MDNIQTGLMVSAVGLIVTFSALLIFIGVIVLLQKLFPAKNENKVSTPVEATENAVLVAEEKTSSDEAIVAVLAAAAYLRSRRSDQLGSTLLSGPGLYRTTRN